MPNENPYKLQGPNQFWSTGVAQLINNGDAITLGSLKEILFDDVNIASVGSCFASEVYKYLAQENFNFVTHDNLPHGDSFGLGNVYSSRHLRHWLENSVGNYFWDPNTLQKCQEGYVDLLTNSDQIFDTKEALISSRKTLAQGILSVITRSNVLIITLGLTETWRNLSGDTLAFCPGTLKGKFSKTEYFFQNLTYSEIIEDLHVCIEIIKSISEDTTIALTVSPVPLTATATDKHVIEASAYSKSVLRAAAGEIADAYECVYYLPSYELVTHANKNDFRFQENLRSVSKEGVDHVMTSLLGTSKHKSSLHPQRYYSPLTEEHCTEDILEKLNTGGTVEKGLHELYLIGDSHMQRLCDAFVRQDVRVHGGMILPGSGFTDQKFEYNERHILDLNEEPGNPVLWQETYEALRNKDGNAYILTNIGSQAHRFIPHACNSVVRPLLTYDDIHHYYTTTCANQMKVLSKLKEFGLVYFVEDPNFYTFNLHENFRVHRYNFDIYSNYLRNMTEKIGIEYLSLCRDITVSLTGNSGTIQHVCESDGFHGTPAYYDELASHILSKL